MNQVQGIKCVQIALPAPEFGEGSRLPEPPAHQLYCHFCYSSTTGTWFPPIKSKGQMVTDGDCDDLKGTLSNLPSFSGSYHALICQVFMIFF